MKPTRRLHQLGQSLWLDKITRGLQSSGAFQRYEKLKGCSTKTA